MPMLKLRAGVLPAILLVMLLLPAAALAQTPTRSMKLNQIRGSGWPAVAVNFNLRSLNNTPLGDIKPDQFVIEENGVAHRAIGSPAKTQQTTPRCPCLRGPQRYSAAAVVILGADELSGIALGPPAANHPRMRRGCRNSVGSAV